MGDTTGSHHDVVRRSFRAQTAQFEGPSSPFAARGDAAVAWVGPLHSDDLVLEVACGAAHVAEPIAPFVRQVVGLDLTRELLHIGAARLAEHGVVNVLLQEGDAEALPFVDGSFDMVVCRSSLHHFGDPGRAVAEMRRVARRGGRVVVSDLVVPVGADRGDFDRLHRLLDASHVRCLTESELDAVCATGADVDHAETTDVRLPLGIAITEQSDADAVVAALRGEMAGGDATGFEPAADGDALTVVFRTRVVRVRRD